MVPSRGCATVSTPGGVNLTPKVSEFKTINRFLVKKTNVCPYLLLPRENVTSHEARRRHVSQESD